LFLPIKKETRAWGEEVNMKDNKVITVFLLIKGEESEVEVSSKNALCDYCEGEGQVSRFRDEAFTQGDFDSFEEFSEFAQECGRGMYDVKCPECKGNKVVRVPDLSELSPEELEGYRNQQREEESFRREQESERRMGA
jgi:DnaJ-class molecular chaperone